MLGGFQDVGTGAVLAPTAGACVIAVLVAYLLPLPVLRWAAPVTAGALIAHQAPILAIYAVMAVGWQAPSLAILPAIALLGAIAAATLPFTCRLP